MSETVRNVGLFAIVAGLIVITGFTQSWNAALLIFNMGLISAIMALGVNLQWGFAGLFNIGIMGFVALGGLAAVLVSMPPTNDAWAAGGLGVLAGLVMGAATIVAAAIAMNRMAPGRNRTISVIAILIIGFFVYRAVLDPSVEAVEKVSPAATGYLCGLGLPILLAWPVGGVLAVFGDHTTNPFVSGGMFSTRGSSTGEIQYNPSGDGTTWVNMTLAPASAYTLTYSASGPTINGQDLGGYTVLTMAGGTTPAPSGTVIMFK